MLPMPMAALQNHRGQPLTDADGQVLKVGSTVVDSTLCSARALLEALSLSRRATA